MALVIGRFFEIIAAVKRGYVRSHPFCAAVWKLDTGGEPMEACTKATKSASDSECMTVPAEATESDFSLLGMRCCGEEVGKGMRHSFSSGSLWPLRRS